MNKLLVVFNTCGISGKDNTNNYIKSLYSLLTQEFDGFKVCLSSCLNSELSINRIKNTFGNKLSYNVVNESLPISVTFNLAIENCIKKFGAFDAYLYIDSGCILPDKKVLYSLYKTHIEENSAICAALPDSDTGANQWFGVGQGLGDESETHKLFGGDKLFKIPIGKTTNLHCQTFDKSWLESYGRILPDIFAGHCMESVFSFMCAALNKNFILSSTSISHIPNMDGGSSGFRPESWENQGGNRWDHPFGCESIVQRLLPGQTLGLGYEECAGIITHPEDKFDENGFALDVGLKDFIRNSLFLKQDEFDYSNIDYKFY